MPVNRNFETHASGYEIAIQPHRPMLAFSQTLGGRGVFAGIGVVVTLGVLVDLEEFGVAGRVETLSKQFLSRFCS